MGTFIGHVLPGTLFFMVGIWHVWCSVYRYVVNTEGFRLKVWNPVPGFGGRLKCLELYMVTIGAFTDLCMQLLYATRLTFFVNGALNPYHMNSFEHSGMLVMFFIYGVIVLLWQKTSFLPLLEGTLCLVAATAFTSEFLLFNFHSTNHKGLEGYYHFILVLLVGLCILTTMVGAIISTSFLLDLSIGIAIALQGLWFYQTTFALYGPMMPDGCTLEDDEIVCSSSDSLVRGELLENFQLFSLVFCMLVGVIGAYSFVSLRFGHSGSAALRDTEVDLDRD